MRLIEILKVQSEFGWQQYWQYQAEPIDASMAQRKFSSPIQDCEQAKWYLLVHTLYTKGHIEPYL